MGNMIFWIVGIVLWGLLTHVYIWKHYHYICPKCHHPFKPTFFHSLTAFNAADERRLQCPNCHEKIYMKAIKNQKKNQKS